VPGLVVEKEPEEGVLEVPVIAEVPVQEKIYKIDNEDDYVYEDDFDEQHVDAQHEQLKNRAVPLPVPMPTPTTGTTTESFFYKDRLGLEEEEDEPFLSVLRKKVCLANSQRSIEIRGESPPPSSPNSSSGPFSQFPTEQNAAQLNHISVSVL